MKKQQHDLEEISTEALQIKEEKTKVNGTYNCVVTNKGTPAASTPLLMHNNEAQRLLQYLKFAFYNQMRSGGIAEIYKFFLNQEPVYIPKKFREGIVPGDSEARRGRMKKLEIMRVTLEIEGMEEECSKHQKIIDETEKQIDDLIGQNDDPTIRQELKQQWFAEIKREEGKSRTIWEKKRIFFENLPNNDVHCQEEDNTRSNFNFSGKFNRKPYNKMREKNYIEQENGRYEPREQNYMQRESNRWARRGQNYAEQEGGRWENRNQNFPPRRSMKHHK